MVWKELQEHRNTKKRKKKKKKQTLETVISTLASIFYLHFSQTATVGFLLHVLYVFFWLKGWRFSLPDLGIWCGPSIWCTSLPVYRWPPRSSAFGAVTSRALGTEYPGCQGSRLHSLLSSYWGRLFTHVIVFSFPLITFHRLTNRGQVGDRDYWRKGDASVLLFPPGATPEWLPSRYSGELGVSLILLGFDCTKIWSCQTSDFLWFTSSTFRAPRRQFDDVLRAYTLTPMMSIFVKHMALQQEPLFLRSPSLTLTWQPLIPTLWSSCHLSLCPGVSSGEHSAYSLVL